MSKLVAVRFADVREQLIQTICRVMHSWPDDALVDCSISRGEKEVTKPGDSVESWETADGWTIIITANGGARTEPLSRHDQLMRLMRTVEEME